MGGGPGSTARVCVRSGRYRSGTNFSESFCWFTPLSGNRWVIRFRIERISHSTLKHRFQLPCSFTFRAGRTLVTAKGSPATTAHSQTACRCIVSQSDKLSHWGRMRALLPACSNRSERLEKSTRWRREGRQGLAICPWAPAIPAFTQSASPIQLYFPSPNRAIGIAAPVPKMPENLQKSRLHQFRGFAAI